MYTEHFGLSDNPFRLTPDPRFLYFTPNHREALASLVYGVLDRKGFMLLTGDAGTGKTTLVHALLDILHHKKAACAFVFHPVLEPKEFLDYVLADFGVKAGGRCKSEMLRALHDFLLKQHQADSTAALIIDEAHKLPAALLEEVRLFSNLETARAKLLQIVLAGQSELDELFRRKDMRQFRQRITLRSRLEAFLPAQTAEYINHRVAACGGVGEELFPPHLVPAIHSYSLGIPRLINGICDSALLLAYAQDAPAVSAAMVEEVACDLDLTNGFSEFRQRAGVSQPAEARPAAPPDGGRSYGQPAPGPRPVPQPLRFLESYGDRNRTMSVLAHWAEKLRIAGKPARN